MSKMIFKVFSSQNQSGILQFLVDWGEDGHPGTLEL